MDLQTSACPGGWLVHQRVLLGQVPVKRPGFASAVGSPPPALRIGRDSASLLPARRGRALPSWKESIWNRVFLCWPGINLGKGTATGDAGGGGNKCAPPPPPPPREPREEGDGESCCWLFSPISIASWFAQKGPHPVWHLLIYLPTYLPDQRLGGGRPCQEQTRKRAHTPREHSTRPATQTTRSQAGSVGVHGFKAAMLSSAVPREPRHATPLHPAAREGGGGQRVCRPH